MGSMLRSDKMSFCEVYLQPEVAFEAMSRLGGLCCCQFVDMNADVATFHRKYISEVCRCEEMERKLRFMNDEMKKENIYVPHVHHEPNPMQPNEMIVYESILEKWEEDIKEMAANQTTLMKNYLELSELYYVLTHIGPILGDAELYMNRNIPGQGGGELEKEGHLVVITGVVMRTRSFPLELMLWRISKGNIFYRHAAEDKILTDPYTGMQIRKVAFLAICQGDKLRVHMEKVCNGFRANTYPCPRTPDERMEMAEKLSVRLQDMDQVLKKTNFYRCKALRTVGRQYQKWSMSVKKSKAIFHTLNLFTLDITKKCLIGRCWVPDQDLKNVQNAIETASKVVDTTAPSFISKIHTDEGPPTFHRTNKFTRAFQNLINAYGDSTYRELNPGLYTIVTFPFLFSMMFGDIGHALIMFLFATWMLANEKKFEAQRSTNEIWNIFFGGRYIIFLMSLFSMYTGFIYNDVFSIRMMIINSSWFHNKKAINETLPLLGPKSLDPKKDVKVMPYYLGIDPMWALAQNKIVVENSLKMKLSIIIGVVHMLFGLILSYYNYVYFKKKHAIYLEFLPQIIFLLCLFAYLCFMIFFKWFKYDANNENKSSAGCAPLILIYFIDMFLMSDTKPATDGCDSYMYPFQKHIQMALVGVALCCVPIMLFGSPLWIMHSNKKKRKQLMKLFYDETPFRKYQARRMTDAEIRHMRERELAKYNTPFMEMMTHQGVHTIEFALSTISHTASYLRLWALSLAHAQLSEMLWMMVLSKYALQEFTYHAVYRIFLMFPVWAVLSVAIMVLMEGLSAFLHTLRLHWVEFMSKFYGGLGYKFQPFCFNTILRADTDDKQSAYCGKLGKKSFYEEEKKGE